LEEMLKFGKQKAEPRTKKLTRLKNLNAEILKGGHGFHRYL
jgi:hypothetical protein